MPERKTKYEMSELLAAAEELNRKIIGLSPEIDLVNRVDWELEMDIEKIAEENSMIQVTV